MRGANGTSIGLLSFVLVTGCGRCQYELLDATNASDASVDAADASDAGDAGGAVCDWTLGPPTFDRIERIPGTSSAADEREAFVAADGVTFTFARHTSQEGSSYVGALGANAWDVGSVTTLAGVYRTPADDDGVVLDARLLEAFAPIGANGATDLYRFTRASVGDPFGNETLVGSTQSGQPEVDPYLSNGGLRLWYASLNPAGGSTGQDILYVDRPSLDAAFGPPSLASDLNGGADDADPAVTDDETLVVFASRRVGGDVDLYYATRASRSQPWSLPRPIDALNTGADDAEPFLTADRCSIYFSSSQLGADLELFYAHGVP